LRSRLAASGIPPGSEIAQRAQGARAAAARSSRPGGAGPLLPAPARRGGRLQPAVVRRGRRALIAGPGAPPLPRQSTDSAFRHGWPPSRCALNAPASVEFCVLNQQAADWRSRLAFRVLHRASPRRRWCLPGPSQPRPPGRPALEISYLLYLSVPVIRPANLGGGGGRGKVPEGLGKSVSLVDIGSFGFLVRVAARWTWTREAKVFIELIRME
jgi:hypothetical protein